MNEQDFEQLRQAGNAPALEVEQARLIKQHENKIDALLSVFRLIAMPGRADEDTAQVLTEIRQIARRVLKENQP